MGIARNIARLIPNGSGLLPNANIEAVAATKLTGTLPDANAPSGSVIQVVSTTLTTNVTISAGTTAVDISGLSVNITPISTSSRILVLINLQFNNADNEGFVGRCDRNGTLLAQNTSGANTAGFFSLSTANANNYWLMSSSGAFLDSPATTSLLTYKAQVCTVAGTKTIFINRTSRGNSNDASGTSTITVMEIAG